MNITATAWYRAVPSIFIVAPKGSTKLETDFETPRFSSAVSIVSGSVALEEEVENATKGTEDILE